MRWDGTVQQSTRYKQKEKMAKIQFESDEEIEIPISRTTEKYRKVEDEEDDDEMPEDISVKKSKDQVLATHRSMLSHLDQ